MFEPIIQIRDLTKSFGAHTVLDGITFDIPRNAVTTVMGPSGTGKSVLLKHVIGLLKPDQGSILVDGDDVCTLSEKNLYRVRMKMGVLFQDGALFGSMSLYDNIAFPLREHTRRSEREIRGVVMSKAELVGLRDHLKKFPGEISGGMRKRAGLARALVLDPEIVLFDEPDSGLDPVRVAYLDELILKTKEETESTFVVITHNVASTVRVADYMAILFRSNLAAFGAKADLLASADPVVAQFLHGRAFGPIGMDELADEESEIEQALAEASQRRMDAAAGNGGVQRDLDGSPPRPAVVPAPLRDGAPALPVAAMPAARGDGAPGVLPVSGMPVSAPPPVVPGGDLVLPRPPPDPASERSPDRAEPGL